MQLSNTSKAHITSSGSNKNGQKVFRMPLNPVMGDIYKLSKATLTTLLGLIQESNYFSED